MQLGLGTFWFYTRRWLRWRGREMLRPVCLVRRHRFKFDAGMCLRCRKPQR